MKIAVCDDQPNQIAEVKRIWQMYVDDNFYYELSEFRCAEDLLPAVRRLPHTDWGCRKKPARKNRANAIPMFFYRLRQ